jgi:hydrid cluster protein-associated redox disulfide domain
MIITEEMLVCDIIDMNEKLEEVFMKHNLPCLGCPGAMQETLKEAAEGHGIDINALLRDLNEENSKG